jgi:hypothetical protein
MDMYADKDFKDYCGVVGMAVGSQHGLVAWEAWKASREYMTVELPAVSIDMYGTRNGYFCAKEAIQWTADAIHASGIRTK